MVYLGGGAGGGVGGAADGRLLSSTLARLRPRHPDAPDPEKERHATWLELLFDLVFVLALLGVTGRQGSRPSPSAIHLGTAVALHLLVYWSWLGQSFYDTRYDPDDTPHRLLVLTATLESVNARVRRAVGARGHFPNEAAALTCAYLAVMSLDPTGQAAARAAGPCAGNPR